MKAFINVRGCNGSGKTTLLRSLGKEPGAEVHYMSIPLRANEIPPEYVRIPMTHVPSRCAVLIGDYTPDAKGTTAGCDKIKTQDAAKEALNQAAFFRSTLDGIDFVLFEGVVISTIYGPWKDWAASRGHPMWWAFLDTPVEVCLERIQQRNGGQPIKEDLVRGKHETIARVKAKALADNLPVWNLEWEKARTSLLNLMSDVTAP